MTNLSLQKRMAASLYKVGLDRVKLDPSRAAEIKEAITKDDIRKLVKEGAIKILQKQGVSRARARKRLKQKRKGRRKGPGSRKGSRGARLSRKEAWMQRIRAQRKFLKMLKDKGYISQEVYRMLRQKAKGGFFRSVRHIKMFIEEFNLAKKK